MRRRFGLVSCVKSKAWSPQPAKDLYVSAYFRKMRAHVESTCDGWRILSAKHGLLHPDAVVEPYELTLKNLPSIERRRWAARVHEALLADLPPATTGVVEVHAGEDYAADLVPLLRDSGYVVDLPLAGLSIGQRLSWYNRADSAAPAATSASSPDRAPSRSPEGGIAPAEARRSPVSAGLSRDAFQRELDLLLLEATRRGASTVDVRSGDLHRRVGGYPGPSHAMPTCCGVMRGAMRGGDRVVQAPPAGKGATLVIRYGLSR